VNLQPCAILAAAALLATLCSCSSAESADPVPTEPEIVADDAPIIAAQPPTAEDEASAIQAAGAVMTAFANPTATAHDWLDSMYPLLSQRGAADYQGTDPSQIAAHRVTGPGSILPSATNVALTVDVPTDAGNYVVALSRPSTRAPWLADRIRPAGR
jgi:hypothetical protein